MNRNSQRQCTAHRVLVVGPDSSPQPRAGGETRNPNKPPHLCVCVCGGVGGLVETEQQQRWPMTPPRACLRFPVALRSSANRSEPRRSRCARLKTPARMTSELFRGLSVAIASSTRPAEAITALIAQNGGFVESHFGFKVGSLFPSMLAVETPACLSSEIPFDCFL